MDDTPTLCDDPPFAHARANGAAVTVYAGLHDVRWNRTTLYYALDNVSTGILMPWDRGAMPNTKPHHGTHHVKQAGKAHHSWEVAEARACGGVAKQLRKPRCQGMMTFSVMCRIVVAHMQRCPIELHWPSLSLSVSASICRKPLGPYATRVGVSVCAPFYLPPDATSRTAEGPLQRLAQWVERWTPQLDGGRIHLHAYNKGALVKRALERAHAPLFAAGRLELTRWNFFEAMGMRLRPVSLNLGSSVGEGLNANHPHYYVLTKSLLELRGRTEWLIMVDVDEFWMASPNSPPLFSTAASFLHNLPSSVQQYSACAINDCSGGVVHWRPKSALRIGRRACEWWGHPHAGVMVERFDDSLSCGSLDADGKTPVDIFANAGGRQTWSAFEPLCRRRQENKPMVYFAHERPGSALCKL